MTATCQFHFHRFVYWWERPLYKENSNFVPLNMVLNFDARRSRCERKKESENHFSSDNSLIRLSKSEELQWISDGNGSADKASGQCWEMLPLMIIQGFRFELTLTPNVFVLYISNVWLTFRSPTTIRKNCLLVPSSLVEIYSFLV